MIGFTTKQFCELLRKHGWIPKNTKGNSHLPFEKLGVSRNISVPMSRKEICRPLAKRLLKEAGILI